MTNVRYAPVPSENLNMEALRIFLFNWLFAKKYNGGFFIRFGDTNSRFSFDEYKESFLRSLAWLGFDEYFDISEQSKRHELYRKTAIDLVKKGYAYPCFCQRTQIIERKKRTGNSSINDYGYDGYCKNLSYEEISRKLSSGLKPAYRFIVKPEIISINDMIKGNISFDTSFLSDFIILRSDGTGTYNLACTVDDILMNISHVIREEKQLQSTPGQILIYKALKADIPSFAHLPPALPEKSNLASNKASVAELRKMGFLPLAILNCTFFTGLCQTYHGRLFSLSEMLLQFNPSKISKSHHKFDSNHLRYFNGKVIKKLDNSTLISEIIEFLMRRGVLKKKPGKKILHLLNGLMPELKKKTIDISGLASIFYSIISEAPLFDKGALKQIGASAYEIKLLNEIVNNNTDMIKIGKEINMKPASLGKLVRIAITGQAEGLSVTAITQNISRSILKRRVMLLSNPGGSTSPVKTNNPDNINANLLRYYFEKRFNLKITHIKKLRGYRNLSWKITCKDMKFVLKRAIEADFDKLYSEKEVLACLGKSGITASNPYLDISGDIFTEPILIYNWVDGKPLKALSPQFFKTLAEYICSIHSYSILTLQILPTYSLVHQYVALRETFSHYLNLRKNENGNADELSDLIFKHILLIESFVRDHDVFWHKRIPLSLLHRDLRGSNLIKRKTGLIAIDWEEAHLGDPAYELSWFFRTNSFNERQEKKFLEYYISIYEEKFPEDRTLRERINGYKPVIYIYYYLLMMIRCLDLQMGNIKTSVSFQDFIQFEAEQCYRGLASAFNYINKTFFTGEEEHSSSSLINLGNFLITGD